MPSRKDPPEFAAIGEKDNWHPYHLQSLAPNKFAVIVTRILTGRYQLVDSRPRKDD